MREREREILHAGSVALLYGANETNQGVAVHVLIMIGACQHALAN